MKRHQYRHDALIEILHTAQERFGHLEPDLLYFIAHQMKLPPSRVWGVATFYHFFTLKPPGRHTCVICTGTACFVRGAAALLAAARQATHLNVGETTIGGELSLLSARCVGACGIAPTVVLDGTVAGPQSPAHLLQKIEGWLERGPLGSA
jgi:bidirectional [NiFe] hydrogenase diaphorase subunit